MTSQRWGMRRSKKYYAKPRQAIEERSVCYLMNSYYVYILRCADGTLYTGVTNDYEERINQHHTGVDPRSYTFRRRPVKLAYIAEFGDVNDAISWEKKVKRWSRKKKEALIAGEYEKLKNLASCINWTKDLSAIEIRSNRYDSRIKLATMFNLSS